MSQEDDMTQSQLSTSYLSTSNINGSTNGSTRKVRHLYSMKDIERQSPKERDQIDKDMKAVEKQVQETNQSGSVDEDLLKQFKQLKAAFEAHVAKSTEIENIVVSLRAQKTEMQAEIDHLKQDLTTAQLQVSAKDTRIRELERGILSSNFNIQPSQASSEAMLQQQQLLASLATTSTSSEVSQQVQEIQHILGTVNDKLSQLSEIKRTVEGGQTSVTTQLQSMQSQMQSSFNEVKETQSTTQTAVSYLSTLLSSFTTNPPSSTSTPSTPSTPSSLSEKQLAAVDTKVLTASFLAAGLAAAITVGLSKLF